MGLLTRNGAEGEGFRDLARREEEPKTEREEEQKTERQAEAQKRAGPSVFWVPFIHPGNRLLVPVSSSPEPMFRSHNLPNLPPPRLCKM